jgi:hypothetical protein
MRTSRRSVVASALGNTRLISRGSTASTGRRSAGDSTSSSKWRQLLPNEWRQTASAVKQLAKSASSSIAKTLLASSATRSLGSRSRRLGGADPFYLDWLDRPKNMTFRAAAAASGLTRVRNADSTIHTWVEREEVEALLDQGWLSPSDGCISAHDALGPRVAPTGQSMGPFEVPAANLRRGEDGQSCPPSRIGRAAIPPNHRHRAQRGRRACPRG